MKTSKFIVALMVTVLLASSCATMPRLKAPDVFQVAQLAITTAVIVEPSLKPEFRLALEKVEQLIDKDAVQALTMLLSWFPPTNRYAPLISEALQAIIADASDLKLRPEIINKTKVMLANLRVILDEQ